MVHYLSLSSILTIITLVTSYFAQINGKNLPYNNFSTSLPNYEVLSGDGFHTETEPATLNIDELVTFSPDQLAYYHEMEESHPLLSKAAVVLEPEATMTIEEIIVYHGYPLETYQVTTEDGYILDVQRIPRGLVVGPGDKPRKPVLVQHGLLCSAASWVTNTKEKNLPYILADAGYDVWLGNIRGTVYGKKHLKLTPDQKQFWAYSFDEMAKYDLPAVIDLILTKSGYKNILYVGHSMGTTMAFALLSTQPKYNQIIKGVLALAPVAFVGHMKSPITYLKPFTKEINFLLHALGTGELMSNSPLLKAITTTVCVSPVRILCSSIIFIFCGFNLAQLNQTRLPVILHHTPDATSVQNVVHLAQMAITGKFQFHDYGVSENKKRYGQISVPLYNLSKISAPVALFWSDNDLLADPNDVSKLSQILPNLVLKHRVPMAKFSHTDYIWAIDGKELVYDKVIETMKKMWKN